MVQLSFASNYTEIMKTAETVRVFCENFSTYLLGYSISAENGEEPNFDIILMSNETVILSSVRIYSLKNNYFPFLVS